MTACVAFFFTKLCEFSPAIILFLTLYLCGGSTLIGFWVVCVVMGVDAVYGLGRW